jgi:hypothetical protein
MGKEKKEKEKSKMSKAEAGRLGGQTTKERHGEEFYKMLGEGNSRRLKEVWARVPKKLRSKKKPK